MSSVDVYAWITFIHEQTCLINDFTSQATESSCFVYTTQYIYDEDDKSALERLERQAHSNSERFGALGVKGVSRKNNKQ
jgi:hypothetical protein